MHGTVRISIAHVPYRTNLGYKIHYNTNNLIITRVIFKIRNIKAPPMHRHSLSIACLHFLNLITNAYNLLRQRILILDGLLYQLGQDGVRLH